MLVNANLCPCQNHVSLTFITLMETVSATATLTTLDVVANAMPPSISVECEAQWNVKLDYVHYIYIC